MGEHRSRSEALFRAWRRASSAPGGRFGGSLRLSVLSRWMRQSPRSLTHSSCPHGTCGVPAGVQAHSALSTPRPRAASQIELDAPGIVGRRVDLKPGGLHAQHLLSPAPRTDDADEPRGDRRAAGWRGVLRVVMQPKEAPWVSHACQR